MVLRSPETRDSTAGPRRLPDDLEQVESVALLVAWHSLSFKPGMDAVRHVWDREGEHCPLSF